MISILQINLKQSQISQWNKDTNNNINNLNKEFENKLSESNILNQITEEFSTSFYYIERKIVECTE